MLASSSTMGACLFSAKLTRSRILRCGGGGVLASPPALLQAARSATRLAPANHVRR